MLNKFHNAHQIEITWNWRVFALTAKDITMILRLSSTFCLGTFRILAKNSFINR